MGKKLIGLYGGSFDPIHFGHLNLAVEIMEARGLDEVWFCPAAYNPHKSMPVSSNNNHRMAMVKLAIEGEPRFHITDVDVNRPGPSYTVETLHKLIAMEKEKGGDATFCLLLGEDAARRFYQWRKPEEIIHLARLLIGKRGERQHEPFKGSPEIVDALNRGMTQTRVMDISSTDVRRRLQNREYCGHLVPGKVLDYIFANSLYSNN